MKARTLQVEIFTGSDPTNLTNDGGTELQTWLQNRDEEELIETDVQTVGSELWFIVEYTEG